MIERGASRPLVAQVQHFVIGVTRVEIAVQS